jgi:hypothetical protein
MINAETREEVKGSIRAAAFYNRSKKRKVERKLIKKKKLKIPKEFGRLEDKYLDPLIDKLIEKHKGIKDFIFTDKNVGSILQYIDSQIAEKVMLYFALKCIPVLPIHDSFRIDARLFDELRTVMHRVIYENFGRFIGISNDDFESFLQGMLGKIQKDIDEVTGDKDELRNTLLKDLDGLKGFMTMLEDISKYSAQESIRQGVQERENI